MRYLRFIIIITTTIFFSNCEKDAEVQNKDYPYVITNSPTVNSKGAEFSADLTNIGNQEILKYGFVWSTESNPTIQDYNKLFDGKANKGIYTCKVNSGLAEGQTYYVRAYILTDQYEVYGNVKSFSSQGSLPPVIENFEPKFGPIGTEVIIEGENFSLSKKDNIVKFGEYTASVDSVTETKLYVKVPQVLKPEEVLISIETAGMSGNSNEKFDLWFPWLQKSDRTGTIYSSSTFFSINEKGYIISENSNVLLVYDAKDDLWSDDSSLPENSGDVPLAFSVNGKAYMLLQNYFWEFNPQTNNWTQKDNFPGTLNSDSRYNFGMSINNNIYIGNCYKKYEFWEYDIEQNVWEQKADFIGDFDSPVWGNYSFSVKGYGFLGVSQTGFASNTLWQYSPVDDQWTSKTAIPSVCYDNYCAFVIEDEAFVGLGSKFTGLSSDNVSNEIWKYDFVNDYWVEYHSCPLSMAVYANFSIDNKGYAIGGYTHSYNSTMDVWEFNPAKN